MVTELRVGLANTFIQVENTHTDWRYATEHAYAFIGAPPECQLKAVQICEPLIGATKSDHKPLLCVTQLPRPRVGNCNNVNNILPTGETLRHFDYPASDGTPGDKLWATDLSFAKLNTIATRHEGATMPTLDKVTVSTSYAAKHG